MGGRHAVIYGHRPQVDYACLMCTPNGFHLYAPLAQNPHYSTSTATSLPGVVLTGGHSDEGIFVSVALKQP